VASFGCRSAEGRDRGGRMALAVRTVMNPAARNISTHLVAPITCSGQSMYSHVSGMRSMSSESVTSPQAQAS